VSETDREANCHNGRSATICHNRRAGQVGKVRQVGQIGQIGKVGKVGQFETFEQFFDHVSTLNPYTAIKIPKIFGKLRRNFRLLDLFKFADSRLLRLPVLEVSKIDPSVNLNGYRQGQLPQAVKHLSPQDRLCTVDRHQIGLPVLRIGTLSDFDLQYLTSQHQSQRLPRPAQQAALTDAEQLADMLSADVLVTHGRTPSGTGPGTFFRRCADDAPTTTGRF
jgi:hypothetical protein